MKTLKYTAAILCLTISIAACKGNSAKVVTDSTQDTTAQAATAGSKAADSLKTDSANKPGADTNAHTENDTLDSRPIH